MALIYLRKISQDDHVIHRQLQTGQLIKLAPEVAISRKVFEELTPWEQAVTRDRAVAMGTYRAVLCSASAARHLGLSLLEQSRGTRVELSYVDGVYAPPRQRLGDDIVFRRSLIRADEVVRWQGFRTTGLIRTLVDLSRYHGVTEGVVAMDSAVRRHDGLTLGKLRQRIGEYRRLRGIGQARRAAELATGLVDSPLETVFRLAAQEWDHPLIQTIEEQVTIILPNGEKVRVDYLINGWLVIELDGESKYDGITFGKPTQRVLRDERLRENAIQQTGRIVVRFVFADLKLRPDGSSRMRDVLGELLTRWGPEGPGSS